MKRLFLSLLISACTLCMAQTNPMKFKGIPMEGTVESFVKKLEAKGCEYIDLTNGEAVLKGDFSAFRDCYIFVMSAPHKNEVHTVGVNMPERETWEAVSIDYFGLKTLLTQKYGTPECTEEFEGEEPPTDFSKLFALLHDECKYVSTYTCKGGTIVLSIKKGVNGTASVMLVYVTDVNWDEFMKKMMDDL